MPRSLTPSLMLARFMLACLLGLLASPALAFKLSPIEAEFAPGRQAVQLFKVENGGTETVAIELTVWHRQMALDGSDQLSPADEEFSIYPDQILLEPGNSQSVRVQWTGSTAPVVEQSYRLVAEQLAIDLDPAQGERSGLRLLVKYLASLYVRPADAAAVLEVSASADPLAAESLLLTVSNTGNAHAILRADMLRLQLAGQPLELSPQQREAIDGKNVLAASQRELRLPWPGDLAPVSALSVALVAADDRP